MSSFICDDGQEWKKSIAVKRGRSVEPESWPGTEMWDLLDEDGMPIGATQLRGEKLPQGTYHRVVEIFTVNSRGELLVTRRAPEKKPYPGMWEVTGGAVIAGEDSIDAARRELREETGLSAENDRLMLLITHRHSSAFIDTYLARIDAQISQMTMQPGETSEARWVTFSEFERMMGDGMVPPTVCLRYATIRFILKNL